MTFSLGRLKNRQSKRGGRAMSGEMTSRTPRTQSRPAGIPVARESFEESAMRRIIADLEDLLRENPLHGAKQRDRERIGREIVRLHKRRAFFEWLRNEGR